MEDIEKHYIMRQPGVDLDNNPRRFFIFNYKYNYRFKQNWRLIKQIRVFIFTSFYRVQNQSRVKQFRMLFILDIQIRKIKYLKRKIYREVSNKELKDRLVEFW